MALGRKIGKIVAWIIAVLIVLIAVLVIVFLTFDWNRARPWVDDKVSQAIGRQFQITGDLKVGWQRPPGETGWRRWVPWPRFSAEKITVANPDWTKQKSFATLDEIDFQVEILPLLAHDIVIPSINLVNPSVDLERLKDNRNNWTFKFQQSTQPSAWSLQLHDIALNKGNIAYADEITKADLEAVVTTLGQMIPIGDVMKQQESASQKSSAQMVGKSGANKLNQQVDQAAASEAAAASAASAAAAANASAPNPASVSANTRITTKEGSKPSVPSVPPVPPYGIGWSVKGKYNNVAVSGDGKVGSVLALQDAMRPFPVQADVRIGDTHIAFVGTVADPAHLAALDLRLWLQGVSLAHLYPIAGVTLPSTPPYATEGRLVGQFKADGNVFRYENFTGRVGGSDLNGSLTFVAREPRPLLSGELVSNLLQFSDLAPIIGADSNASKAERGDTEKQPSSKALPAEEFKTDRWKAIDADVKFTGRKIVKDPALPITGLYTHLMMKDGVLSFEPLSFGVAGGTLSSNIHLDGSTEPLQGRFSTSARHLKLKELLPTVKTMQTALGEVNGDAALSATGNSPAALAATMNGEIKALITDGTVSRLYMEAAGLNVANAVYEKLFDKRDVKINCAAADFVATNGVLESRVFALDTDDAVINMDGTVNLKTEEMDLNIHPHTKGFRVFSLRSPLYVKGTFKDPHVGVSAGALAARGAVAVGLGLLNPFAALIPLIAPSNNKPLPCTQMLADMRTAPSAPPPGQKEKAKGAPGYMEPGVANPAAASSSSSSGAKSRARPAASAPAGALYRGS
ncbi:AsmA family protein [Caballeronia mineralivorans]|uniref:AsmA family protein n=1 Tax=Caballeronia mineralivorans TaxID=2010198 RepID=UPI0023F1C2A9|nr:AsmA family protein [Caballeronia mineralivorans]MDB5789814.1 cell envelope biosis protein AsmA [Caballeronia mineralivorans]MEA3097194.1 AsmA family protein [Caballeronia mineralivorans]